jgi:hypothetical protein
VASIEKNESVPVAVVLRRKGPDPAVARRSGAREYLSHEELAARHGANAHDIDLVEKFAHEAQFTVVESSLRKRRMVLMVTAELMSNAFEVRSFRNMDCRL